VVTAIGAPVSAPVAFFPEHFHADAELSARLPDAFPQLLGALGLLDAEVFPLPSVTLLGDQVADQAVMITVARARDEPHLLLLPSAHRARPLDTESLDVKLLCGSWLKA
jgi:hypothetical protein